jgi:flagellin-like hook-associated protein FlgL
MVNTLERAKELKTEARDMLLKLREYPALKAELKDMLAELDDIIKNGGR